MTCTTFENITDRWFTNISGILACFISILIFTYSMTLVRWLNAKIKPLLPRKRTELDARIEILALEVRRTKSEMDAISPTAQFAAYFKKERTFKQLTAELDAYVKARKREAGLVSTLLLVVVGALVQLLAATLMFYSRNVVVGHVNSTYFWPFNFFLYVPNLVPPMDQNNDDEETPVTLFAFLSLLIFVWRTAYPRRNGYTKSKIS